MHVVAIYNLGADKQSQANALATVLKTTVFEALARLRAPGSGPFVVSVFAEEEQAGALAERLRSVGFSAVVLTADNIEAEGDAWNIRRFGLDEHALRVESVDGQSRTVAYQDIDLILRGIGISSSTATETTKERKFDLGTAVLSSGLKMTKTTKTTREVTTEERAGFLALYSTNSPTLMFRENSLVYDALGPARGLSHEANFAQLTTELRGHCPSARYDDRLLNMAGSAALLGPSLSPEKHLVVATALLAKVLRET
jgi:hypothetical protein